jgi:general secretion pathway protein J
MRRSAFRRGKRVAGFTLVEALLATALMGTILAALATVTAQWLPNWNRGFARVQRSEHLAFGIERLVADLAAAEFVTAGRETFLPLFEGTELSVTFLRTALGPNARPTLEIVRIGEAGSDRGPVLVRMRAPFVPVVTGVNDREQPSFGDPVVLVRMPYRVSFAYAGADRAWRATWTGAPQLPSAIRVTVRDAATERTLAVSTAALVHAELPAECILARSGADCLAQRNPQQVPPAEAGKPREL